MTASTQGLVPPGLAGASVPPQQGSFSPGYSPPLTPEQIFGFPQYGFPQYGYPAATPFQGQPQIPFGIAAQPLVSQLVSQIAPVAQQVILPQVIGMVQQLTTLIAQCAAQNLAGGQAGWQWQAPMTGWQPHGWIPGQFARSGYPV